MRAGIQDGRKIIAGIGARAFALRELPGEDVETKTLTETVKSNGRFKIDGENAVCPKCTDNDVVLKLTIMMDGC